MKNTAYAATRKASINLWVNSSLINRSTPSIKIAIQVLGDKVHAPYAMSRAAAHVFFTARLSMISLMAFRISACSTTSN